MNRIDKVVVFKPLGEEQLGEILDLELGFVQERILESVQGPQFIYECTGAAKQYLLREGTDPKYGARHLKRALERQLVYPLSNLIATEQVHLGDLVRVDFDTSGGRLTFSKEAEGLPIHAMAGLSRSEVLPRNQAAAPAAVKEQPARLKRAS